MSPLHAAHLLFPFSRWSMPSEHATWPHGEIIDRTMEVSSVRQILQYHQSGLARWLIVWLRRLRRINDFDTSSSRNDSVLDSPFFPQLLPLVTVPDSDLNVLVRQEHSKNTTCFSVSPVSIASWALWRFARYWFLRKLLSSAVFWISWSVFSVTKARSSNFCMLQVNSQ